MMKALLGLSDLAFVYKVTAALNRSNLNQIACIARSFKLGQLIDDD